MVARFEAMKERELAPPEVIDAEIEEYKNQERGRRAMKELINGSKETALEQYRGQTALSKADALEILHLIYPDVPESELIKVALTCVTYRLNPLPAVQHIYIVPFGKKWAQMLSIRATRLIARRAAMKYHYSYGYTDFTPRIMKREEQIKINGAVDDNQIWAITILEDTQGLKVYGIGVWPKAVAAYGAEKGNTRENMAKIRSERNALDKLFPGEMVRDIEVVDEAYMSSIRVVDGNTGEITEEKPPPTTQASIATLEPNPEAEDLTTERTASSGSGQASGEQLYEMRKQLETALRDKGVNPASPNQIAKWLGGNGFIPTKLSALGENELKEALEKVGK